MGVTDGTILGTTKIVDNGPAAERWNLVIFGDGYQSGQMAQYASDVASFVDTLLRTPPFDALGRAINVYRVDVTSTDAGADDPTTCGGTGAAPRTYFDAAFCNFGIQRLLVVDDGAVIGVANAQVPEWHMLMVVVNTTIYGGSGGSVATWSLAPGANEIALHEMGHTAFGLADEYEYYAGCGIDTDRDNHPPFEPVEPNVTIDSNRDTIKWRTLIAPETAVPTTRNADPTRCDPQPNPVSAATVGAFEGAHYYHAGAFRPQFDCRMRALGFPYCAVCARRIHEVLEPYLPKTTAGEGAFYFSDGKGNLRLARAYDDWRNSWASIVTGYFSDSRYTELLFYDRDAGEGEFYESDGGGGIRLLKKHSGWRRSWSIIVPGDFGRSGYTDLLFYDSAAGEGEIYTTDANQDIHLLKQHTGWRRSWSIIVPGDFGGSANTDLLFYDPTAGEAEFYTTDRSGELHLLKKHTGWRRSWSIIVPGNFGGSSRTDLLFYDPTSGEGEVHATDGRGNLRLLQRYSGWRRSWSIIAPGRFGGKAPTDLLFYDPAVGEGEIYTSDGRGNLRLLAAHTGWRRDWSLIVPGAYGASSYTDVLFYARNR